MKLLCLISGGIDSPVAAWVMLRKGFDLEFVHFHMMPFGHTHTLEKVRALIRQLEIRSKKRFKLHIIPHGKWLGETYQKLARKNVLCVVCRRRMLKQAERLAKKLGCSALLTGENLAQVASQTLDNLAVEEEVVKIPIIRPLIAWDKNEIIKVARQIGTYKISIEPGGCCTLTPRKPETRANLQEIKKAEHKSFKV